MIDENARINESGEIIRENAPEQPVTKEIEPVVNIDTLGGQKVEAVCQGFALNPKEVYVPGSGTDVLPPLSSLEDSHIVYADMDEKAVDTLQKAGYTAVLADVEANPPKNEIDLLILNGITVKKPLDLVKQGGFAYSDGRMGSAESIAQNHEDFSLVGVIVDEVVEDAQGRPQRKPKLQKEGLDIYAKNLRRTEEELADVRRSLRMQLLGGGLSPAKQTEPAPPPATGYVFQKK